VSPLVQIAGLVMSYGGLRPLRIEELSVRDGEHAAIHGLDQPAAETLINLVTGAVLPDAGEIRVFGRATADITDSAEWLALIDRFGIVTERAVLLEGLTTIQNLALPFSLDIEPPSDELRQKAIDLAREVGLAESDWNTAVGELDGAARLRVRIGRAFALGPSILLLEHPTARSGGGAALGADLRGAASRRGVATLTLTADEAFAASVADVTFDLEPATGRLKPRRRRWFR
jgi:ABC-type transporter Mla maintaining outer membrane lipid asymmetry ATPase subunit MlaF